MITANTNSTGFVRNNIFASQIIAPIQIVSTDDGIVEYSYNLFYGCAIDSCFNSWYVGNLSSASSAHDNLFDIDPLFVNPAIGNFRLYPNSPAIDAGDPAILHEFLVDGNGDDEFRIDIGAFENGSVPNVAPVVIAGDDQTVEVGNGVTVNATYSDADSPDGHFARIDWGDGNIEDVLVAPTGPNAGEVIGEHTYSDEGNYTVEVCVTDLYGAAGCDTVGVAVTVTEPVNLYLHGSGANANPSTLYLDFVTPENTSAKYKDSTSDNFNNGNPWKEVGAWTANPMAENGSLSALEDLHIWLGLKNSDDIGTRFDLRAEVYKNGVLVASGETLCVTGLVRNANQAKEVIVTFEGFDPTTLSIGDVLSIKIMTRIGTDGVGNHCGGHSNAVGLRLYFDALNRPSRLEVIVTP